MQFLTLKDGFIFLFFIYFSYAIFFHSFVSGKVFSFFFSFSDIPGQIVNSEVCGSHREAVDLSSAFPVRFFFILMRREGADIPRSYRCR